MGATDHPLIMFVGVPVEPGINRLLHQDWQHVFRNEGGLNRAGTVNSLGVMGRAMVGNDDPWSR